MEVKKVIKLPHPTKYQQQIIDYCNDDSIKYISIVAGRQCGKSFLLKMLVTKFGLEAKNNIITYVTPTFRLSRLFYKQIVTALKDYIKTENATELRIDFITGSYLQFFSSESKDSIRGFQSTILLIDESAYIDDLTFQNILYPTLLVKGKKMILASTPCGASGFFHKYVMDGLDNKPGYAAVTTNIYENPFVTKEQIESIKSQVPLKSFQQEYLGEFLDGSGAVFSNYKNCLIKGDIKKSTTFFAAIDLAKSVDYSVLTIMNEFKQVVYRYRVTGLDYTVQVKQFIEILNKWKPIITILELNNIGSIVAEMMKKDYKGKMKYITLDNAFKREIIEDLIVAFEQGKIEIDNDENLLRELAAFSVNYNPQTQTVKYGAKNGFHDDCVISLSYCYYACSKLNKNNYSISFI